MGGSRWNWGAGGRRGRAALALLGIWLALGMAWRAGGPAQTAEGAPAAASTVYLPLTLYHAASYRVNAPHFASSVTFGETAIFWFGQITPAQNYTDVRVAYTDQYLYLYLAVFDRRLWYDATPAGTTLEDWDAATIFLDLSGSPAELPGASSYRFVASLANLEARGPYEATYRGSGAGWAAQALLFTSTPGWRGTALNDGADDRGWAMTFRVPFASLGLSGPPAQGTGWALGVSVHDRDDAAGPALGSKSWPPGMLETRPASWGRLSFGLPAFIAPPLSSTGSVTIRDQLAGAQVPDAAVGGGAVCGDGLDLWTQCGNANYGARPDVNVQNQSDIADWPCFSRYYVTFPLDALPDDAKVISATLELHQTGNAGAPGEAQPSLIQVSLVEGDWSEGSLTWNNAPLAIENVSRATVKPITGCGSTMPWPCTPRRWDVSRAVALAHAAGSPLRLALYSADDAYHSGKYFSSSETGDWNAVGRPTLRVVWAE